MGHHLWEQCMCGPACATIAADGCGIVLLWLIAVMKIHTPYYNYALEIVMVQAPFMHTFLVHTCS